MSLDVKRKVIRSSELPVAVVAAERLVPGVLPLVPGQLVRPEIQMTID